MSDYNSKSNEKQVRETVPMWSHNSFLPTPPGAEVYLESPPALHGRAPLMWPKHETEISTHFSEGKVVI